jgi:hypothetical protein
MESGSENDPNNSANCLLVNPGVAGLNRDGDMQGSLRIQGGKVSLFHEVARQKYHRTGRLAGWNG